MFTLKTTTYAAVDGVSVAHTETQDFAAEAEANVAAGRQSPASAHEQVVTHSRGYWRRVSIDDSRWGIWESYPAA